MVKKAKNSRRPALDSLSCLIGGRLRLAVCLEVLACSCPHVSVGDLRQSLGETCAEDCGFDSWSRIWELRSLYQTELLGTLLRQFCLCLDAECRRRRLTSPLGCRSPLICALGASLAI